MFLTNKIILVVSPQPWSNMYVSKHHYAIELSKRNNTVYFLSTSSQQNKNLQIEQLPTYPNIYIIHREKFIGELLRFHYRPLYKLLLKRNLQRIVKKINTPFDVVLSFDNTATYPDLSIFNAKHQLFFPFDQINLNHLSEYKNLGKTIFSVSPIILESFANFPNKKKLLNHGLGNSWEEFAKLTLNETIKTTTTLKIGYFGNLTMGKSLDMGTLTTVIQSHPGIEFHFWGNNELKQGVDKETIEWLTFLKTTKNVILYGSIPPNELVNQLHDIDAFLLCYDYNFEMNKCSNSHKILEYLSTGKVIISSKISNYEGKPNLINMLPEFSNKNYLSLFDSTIKNITNYNTDELKKERIAFALDNTYDKQLERIEQTITNS